MACKRPGVQLLCGLVTTSPQERHYLGARSSPPSGDPGRRSSLGCSPSPPAVRPAAGGEQEQQHDEDHHARRAPGVVLLQRPTPQGTRPLNPATTTSPTMA